MPATGRPAWKPSSKDREAVRMMTAVGIDQEQICRFFKITQKTLRKHCRDEIDSGVAEANLAVGRSMYQMALRAPYTTRFLACRYWLATRAGWRDADKVTIVTVPKASFEMDDAEITALIAREEAYRAACEKAAANGTTVVVPFTPPPPRRKR